MALGYYLAARVPETETAVALSIWVVGAAAVATAAVLVFTFLPAALDPAEAEEAGAGTGAHKPPAYEDVDGDRLVQELRQIEEDRSLRKLTDKAAQAMALPVRRDLAIALATADAMERRDDLAESLTRSDDDQEDKP